ncbi:hypothetical protein EVAR_26679_1 [Eumeta japonica]|uniref:Endonuclease/exonuclease/phosphatase domain-containing protein n=1 Tax=Eumeta variegata TaxID=151549 RepID=A0A4C1VKS9_EUMVA|nr:hypothetical protein EVAR_26679_1 [Eumeta japonica]
MSKLLEEWEEFWTVVRDIVMKCDRKERIVIPGDFNGWMGVQWDGYEKVLVGPQKECILVSLTGVKSSLYPSIKTKAHGRNSDVRERCGLKEDVVTRAERGMLRWFGHLERMDESGLTKQISRTNVCDGKVGKGRPKNPIQTILVAYLKRAKFKAPPKPTILH